MQKFAALVFLLAVAAYGQAIVYPNATRSALRRRAEPGPATPGPCAEDVETLCAGPEDFCCSTDLECEVDEAAATYNCVAPSSGTVCPDDSTLCGETCCPLNSGCLADGSCLVCLSAESPCGEVCCSEGSQCNAESSTCETDGTGTTTTENGSTTKAPSGSTTRGGTATTRTPTGPGGSTISIGATTTPNAAPVNKATSALIWSMVWLVVAA